jgi:acetolactate synthase-1/2/3 large subunit
MTRNFKVTDVVADLLAKNGVRVAFGVSGGAALHIMHSINRNSFIELVTTHHEQAAAMAADSVGRITNNFGVAIATSGPGATNLITGIAGCFYDSVPVVFITGQVSTTRLSGNTGVRQMGFQETPIVEIVKPITKYAVQIHRPEQIILELQKCIQMATTGRKGPTLIDIPDDIQRMEIELLEDFLPLSNIDLIEKEHPLISDSEWNLLQGLVKNAKRPVVILGWGVHLAGNESVIREFLDELKWPVVLTWAAADILDSNVLYRVGTFGTHGTRAANFTVQNADLILSIGSRLDTKSTGSPVKSFARDAKRIMVDLDPTEISKFEKLDWNVDLPLLIDLASVQFITMVEKILAVSKAPNEYWAKTIAHYRNELVRKPSVAIENQVDPYEFIQVVSNACAPKTRIILDTGCTVAWACQEWIFKKEHRMFHDFNNTAMGWALPAAIGSLYIQDEYETIALIGDGSFMMSIQELSTLKAAKKPLKIFLLNNSGYSMIKQTQDQWFGSEYFASNADSTMFFPDYEKICKAFGLEYQKISTQEDLFAGVTNVMNKNESTLCEVVIPGEARVNPQVKFGSPIEGMDPPLDADMFKSLMIIDPR